MARRNRGKLKAARAVCPCCMPHKDQMMRKRPRSKRARAILAESVAAILAASCALSPPPLPPPTGPGDCASACANLERLGCGLGPFCEQDCEDAAAAEAEVGIRLDVACLTAAASCEEARRCR